MTGELGAIAAASPEPDEVVDRFADWAAGRGLPLYPAQEEAVLELVSGAHVVLSTPTGTGKSLVAAAAHTAALARGERSWYTAPIKALVSEKFFALVDLFGPENVGMLTGDSAVNPDAPILCATAEVLANQALRGGPAAGGGLVVMDEFHFYGEPDRGWAWQVPLLTLPDTQFLLMSATLGDVGMIARDLERRTGRPVVEVTGSTRPVPLHYDYATTPVHETVDELVHSSRAPVYIVHFAQAAAVERAQALAGMGLVSKEARGRIAEAIGGFRFAAGFGQTLNRLLRLGVGVHHAGMLPKYRRLVETLAQDGLLPIICGTDTLGVGINVPIRTVLLTALTKFDGTKMRQLSAREFHQIAGRAGRAGYDTAGDVVVQAPDHEVENARLLAKAGDDEKKRKRVVKKRAPDGFVSWSRTSMERLIEREPETLASRMRITHAMVLGILARGGDPYPALRDLVLDNHEPPAAKRALARRALQIARSLVTAGIVRRDVGADGAADYTLTVDLQPGFALNQPLSPFALAAFELIEEAGDARSEADEALDLVSVVEATLDDPRQVLLAQQHRARGEAVAALKADGVDYDTRMELLEEVTHPRPLGELLDAAFEEFRAASPWVGDHRISPKSVVRDMIERAASFGDIVRFYGLARSEGVLLRYLSDAYRALRQTVPAERRTETLADLIAWLGQVVASTDSSLLEEWERLSDPDAPAADDAPPPAAALTIVDAPRAFEVLVRNAMFARVQLLARRDWAALGELDRDAGFDADRWADAFEPYFDEHDAIGTGPDARARDLFVVDRVPGRWLVRQIVDDPDGEWGWSLTATVDLEASAEAGAPAITMSGAGESAGLPGADR